MKLFLRATCQDNSDSYSIFSKSDAEEFLRIQKRDPLTVQKQTSPVLGRYFSGFTVSSLLAWSWKTSRFFKGPRKSIPLFPQSFCSSTDVCVCPHPQRSNSIHSVCPSHPETLTALSVPFFPKSTVIRASWLGKVQCSMNANGLAPSRAADMSLDDPLKSPTSQRWSFSCC